MTNREAIFAALFARVSSVSGIVTSSRRLVSWDDVGYGSMPALFQIQGHQEAHFVRGHPQKWSLQADLFLYLDVRNDPEDGPQALNGFLDGIEAALAPDFGPFDQGGACTLGGLVQHCRISRVELFEGVQSGTAIAIFTVEILAV